jgi:hypothetical protein
VLRQIIIYLIIAGSLTALGYFIYQLLQSETVNIDAIALIPENVESVITLERLALWPAQAEEARQHMIDKPEGIQAIWTQWVDWTSRLYALAENDPKWMKAVENSNIAYAGTHALSADPWLFVFVADDPQLGPKDWLSHLTDAPIESRTYKGHTIFQAGEISCAQFGSGIVTSRSLAGIEGCILAQEKKGTLIHHNPFMQAYEVRSSDSALHLFAAYNASEWLQLNPVTQSKGPGFIGLQSASDSTFQTTFIHGTGPAQLEIPSWLPSTTYYWDAIHFDQESELTSACESFYARTPRAAFWQAAWQVFGDSCACDLNEALLSWRNGACGIAAWDINDSVSGEVYYYGILDTLDVIKRMPSSLLKKLNTAAPIYQIQMPILFDRNRVSSINVEPSYLMQLGSYLILGQSLEDLLALHLNAATNPIHPFLGKATKVLENMSRVTYISSASRISTLPSSMHSLLLAGHSHLITFSAASDQSTLVSIYREEDLQPVDGSATNTLPAPIDSLATSSALRVWTVINHLNSSKETLEELQDQNLQLKDEGGKILWRFPKKSPVLGEVQQIDALKNGKLQYAFTTIDGLFVIDRNGQNYAPLCIASSSNVTSGLAVFDYEMNKNYRLVFAMENGEVSNYSSAGTMTEGWKYEKQGIVRHLHHFKQGTDDCILMIDVDGQMHLHKRNGLARNEQCGQLPNEQMLGTRVVAGREMRQTRIQWRNAEGLQKEAALLKE